MPSKESLCARDNQLKAFLAATPEFGAGNTNHGTQSAVLATRALQMAIERRKPEPGLIHHSGRGIQYACAEYAKLLAEAGIQGSMSRVGNPYDNAKAESFMKTLKQEEVNGANYKNLNELRERLEEFFETTYNKNRLHSSLGYLSPNQFESEAES